MYILKLSIVIVFTIISLFTAVFSIIKINNLPNRKFSIKGNYGRIAIYSSIGAVLDLLMAVITIIFCGVGDFGTGIEFMMALIVMIVYTPICLISSHKLKRRMNDHG